MAAIPIIPMVPLDIAGKSMNPLAYMLYDTASANILSRGDLLTLTGGRVRENTIAVAANTLVGVSPVGYSADPATDDVIPVQLALPGWLWEISNETSAALAATAITGAEFEAGRNTTPACAVIDTDGSGAGTTVFYGVSAAVNHSLYQTGNFIGQNATSPTIGSTMRPDARAKGIPGTDTQIRIIVQFEYAATAWSA